MKTANCPNCKQSPDLKYLERASMHSYESALPCKNCGTELIGQGWEPLAYVLFIIVPPLLIGTIDYSFWGLMLTTLTLLLITQILIVRFSPLRRMVGEGIVSPVKRRISEHLKRIHPITIHSVFWTLSFFFFFPLIMSNPNEFTVKAFCLSALMGAITASVLHRVRSQLKTEYAKERPHENKLLPEL